MNQQNIDDMPGIRPLTEDEILNVAGGRGFWDEFDRLLRLDGGTGRAVRFAAGYAWVGLTGGNRNRDYKGPTVGVGVRG
jgi:hypothetical protein